MLGNQTHEKQHQGGGQHIQHLRRVTGYLTGDYKTAFNKGKQAEVEDRYKHSKKLVIADNKTITRKIRFKNHT